MMFYFVTINALLLLSLFTPLTLSTTSDVTFLMIGDWGNKSTELTKNAQAMGVKANETNAKFVFCLGDNFYFNGVNNVSDPQWNTTFSHVFNAASLKDTTFYSILGYTVAIFLSNFIAFLSHLHRNFFFTS